MLTGTPGRRDLEEACLAFGVAPGLVQTAPELLPWCEVWPECWPAVRLFMAGRTQWRMGPRGAVGLDYAVLPLLAKSLPGGAMGRREQQAAMPGLQVMEDEALEWFAEQAPDE